MQYLKIKILQFGIWLLILFFTILPYSMTALSSNVSAQTTQAPNQMLRVSPFIFDLDLQENTKSIYNVTVENMTDAPMPLRVTPGYFDSYDETGAYIFPDKEPDRSLSRWLTIETRELILGPRAKQSVSFTITTPESLEDGGYYGMVFIEPLTTPQAGNSLLQTKVGVLLLANIGTPVAVPPPIEFVDTGLPRICWRPNGHEIPLHVRNRSLFHISAKPILNLDPLMGDTQQQILEDKVLFPGKSRVWDTAQLNCPLIPGLYPTQFTVSYGDGNMIRHHTTIIAIHLYYLIAGCVLALAIIFATKRKQIIKAFQILIDRKHP